MMMMMSEAEVSTPCMMASVLVWMVVAVVALRELDVTLKVMRMQHTVMRHLYRREPSCH